MFITNSAILANMFALFFVILTVQYVSGDNVPVFLWSAGMKADAIPAVGPISTETFREILYPRLESNSKIIVFSELNLSPEDFIEHDRTGKNTFKHLSELQSDTKVTYLPNVKNPIEALKQVDNFKVSQVPISEFSTKKLNKDKEVIIIDLNDAKDNEDRNDMLRRHDEVIHKFYKELQKDNVMFIFTGYHASWIIPEVESEYKGRSLLAEPEAEDGEKGFYFHESGKYILYLSANAVNEKNETLIEKNTVPTNEMTDDLLTITMGNLKMIVEKTTRGYWNLNNITLIDELYETKNIYAPVGFSYHCSTQTFYNKKDNKKFITLPGLQFQAFLDEKSNTTISFGDAYDCVGFTSAPIWSGLFITFILAFIMTLGLTMMMDIKTMDRFDDPKGKTIIINASE